VTASARVVREAVAELGPWFHDLDLHGVRTAPAHPLGTFLEELWEQVEPAFPADLSGATVLDVGCNAGFYSIRLARRGARVTGIDHDARYLAQARFAAEVLGLEIRYEQLDVYDVERLGEEYDFVLFMGVFYHLRHPLLALDRIARLPRERLVFQTMIRGAPGTIALADDYPIGERAIFENPRMPAMYFVEASYAGDPTNWWVPNESGMEAMLRSAGLRIDAHPAPEVYFCSRVSG
jgi:tRNA (mo5U34)-methyltransferase